MAATAICARLLVQVLNYHGREGRKTPQCVRLTSTIVRSLSADDWVLEKKGKLKITFCSERLHYCVKAEITLESARERFKKKKMLVSTMEASNNTIYSPD